MIEQVLYDLKKHHLLNFFHFHEVLTAECHQNCLAAGVLVDISAMLKEYVRHPES